MAIQLVAENGNPKPRKPSNMTAKWSVNVRLTGETGSCFLSIGNVRSYDQEPHDGQIGVGR